MQIPRKPVEDFNDKLLLSNLWHIQFLTPLFLFRNYRNNTYYFRPFVIQGSLLRFIPGAFDVGRKKNVDER